MSRSDKGVIGWGMEVGRHCKRRCLARQRGRSAEGASKAMDVVCLEDETEAASTSGRGDGDGAVGTTAEPAETVVEGPVAVTL